MKNIKDIIGTVIYTIVHALKKAIDFLADNIDRSDSLMKVTVPYTRQSFSENVRNSMDDR